MILFLQKQCREAMCCRLVLRMQEGMEAIEAIRLQL